MRHLTLGAVVLASALLVGCGSFSNREGSKAADNVYRYPIITNPTSLDPGMVQDGDTLDIIQQVYEGLVKWSPDNLVVPGMAESWDIEDEGRRFVFHLKKGAKFHSGREVTAHDFKWSIERNSDPELASPTITAYLSDIVGMEEKFAGDADEVVGYQVVDDHTIEITLKQPTPYFLGKLTYLVSAVMDKDAAPTGSEMNDLKQMVGTGPFSMKKYVRAQVVELAAFDDYHEGRPTLDEIHRPVITDAVMRLDKYKTGELDMTMLQRQDIEAIQKDPELKDQLQFFQRPAIWYIGMNRLAYPPFQDRRVRRAFAMAIDKELIVNDRMDGINTVANSIVPPGVQGHQEVADFLPYDPAAARKLLAEAGYADGKGLPPLELYYREKFLDINLVAEAAAGMLKENLGVDVKLRTMEWRAYLEKYNAGELPFYHMRWAADYLDAQNFLSHMLASFGPENKMGYNNAEFDDLCRQADSIMEWSEREPLYNRAENIALQDAVWVPIYFQRDAELHRPELNGLRFSLFGHLPHTGAEILRAKD
jgi:ABC-type transport system substrate-binding protein